MMHILLLIGVLLVPTAHADTKSLYNQIKERVELESHTKEVELSTQRYALGTYYDHHVNTIKVVGDERSPDVFTMEKEEFVDYAILENYDELCGDHADKENKYGTCLQVIERLKSITARNTWHRKLGRDLQMIATGYETGIDGYPGKNINIIPRLSSITHLWRAGNDAFLEPFLEVRTRARPYPSGHERDIDTAAKEVAKALGDLTKVWEEKQDDTEKIAMIHRYRHGVRSVIRNEGDCATSESNLSRVDPGQYWLYKRNCALEDKLLNLYSFLLTDRFERGNDEQIIYPPHIDYMENIYIWMRYDDVGTQNFDALEPVHTTLTTKPFLDCMDGDETIGDCAKNHSTGIVRGGLYPRKITREGHIVPEPKIGEGICSHPFGKRGYLCRPIESEDCTLNKKQRDQLRDFGTGGIILTSCKPEQFNYELSRTVSGPNICGIGGWREEVPGNVYADTPQKQPDMVPSYCASCAVDVECKEECIPGEPNFASTSYSKRNGVIDICIPTGLDDPTLTYYLLAHEMTHAQQSCNESQIQAFHRTGQAGNASLSPAGCCSAEREAYFLQCKLMAMDGILERAGITIDQCASANANRSCSNFDTDPQDDTYVCTSDNTDPEDVRRVIADTRKQMVQAGVLKIPTTCEDALKHPSIKAMRNSLPLACKPGCQAQYQNTIGNNLCFTGQCLEETHERSRDVPGRMGLTTLDQDSPWDACMLPDPNLGVFDVPPALLGPKLPQYNPERIIQQLDTELCQINGLPPTSPPVVCGYDPSKTIELPADSYLRNAQDLGQEPEGYEATGRGIEFAAQSIGARAASEMFVQYLEPAARNYADLLNTMYHIFSRVGDLEFPDTMCPRYAPETYGCSILTQ